MTDCGSFSVCSLRLRQERHVVHARQRAREVAAFLGFEHQDQIRLGTAASELARNAFRYANGGSVEFLVRDSTPQLLVISVKDEGPGIPDLDGILNGRYISKTGLGKGLTGTKRLMDHFSISSSPLGTHVETGKRLPSSAPRLTELHLREVVSELSRKGAADPFEELERQNQELLQTLAELREKQDLLAGLNRELEDTNRGVVALYAELDQNAINLRRVSDLKTRFLSNLSHEFRTPLSSILSLSRLLLDRTEGSLGAEQEKQVAFIHSSASELFELVNDLLDLAKVEAGKTEVKPREFEVYEFFGSLRGMLKPLLGKSTLELVFGTVAGLPPLYTDAGKLSQILRNLISNALKFTRQGHVHVTAEIEPGGWIAFHIADTGIGIAPEDQSRIFEEFVQIESDMQAQVKGTGLGLPLSRRIAELLGGTLEVSSELGVGSTFTVRIPERYDPSAFKAADTAHPRSGAAILLVGNYYQESERRQLSAGPYPLIFARSIPEARMAFEKSRPAVVVLDRFIDGEDTLFYVSELRLGGFAAPILVTSLAGNPEHAIDAGADGFLARPLPHPTFWNTIRNLIARKGPRTILLVEDDEVSRYLLRDALQKLGFRTVEAQNGREAIRIAQEQHLNAVFLDILMPDLSGFDVLRELRRQSSSRALPVIIHSSKDFSSEERDLLSGMGALIYSKRAFDEQSTESLEQALVAAGVGA